MCRAATDVTGFGLLGHLYKMCRASGVVGAVIDRGAVPVIEGAREALRDGFISGGTRATSTGSGRRAAVPRPASPRRTCCCSPTRRPWRSAHRRELPGHLVIGHTVAGRGIEVR